LPGRTREGIVDYIYPVLDQQTRTLQVRLRFPNNDGLLKPNMFADVKLMATVGDQVISVPREAVIRSGSHNRVVLAEGNGRYRPGFVKLGVESEDRVQILDGLQAGQQVGTSAQFLIDSESKIGVALAALEEQKKSDAMPQQAVATTVVATGKLDALNPEMNSVTITHDPIEVWQWPTMKMSFKLADSVDSSVLEAGQRIEFEIEKTGQMDYLITSVDVASFASESAEMLGINTEKTVTTQGEIKELIPDAHMLSILHEPIPEWQWPVMNMMFSLAENQSMDSLQVGQQVSFRLTELENGDYLVENIKPLVENNKSMK
jgi:Cu(I)/Ag(I) efflux system membrane fusion protein